MKYFINTKTAPIFAFPIDGSQDELVTDDYRPISESEIVNYNSQKSVNTASYVENRKKAYPPITEYIDAIVKNDQEQLQEYIDACIKVKQQFPKE